MPSAGALTHGGFFYQRGSSGTYDTIISAQHILKSMADSHAAQLAQLQLQLDSSTQLLKSSPAAAAGSTAVVLAAEGKEGKKGRKGAGAPAAADVEGTLMQLVVAGLSTDEDVSVLWPVKVFVVGNLILSACNPVCPACALLQVGSLLLAPPAAIDRMNCSVCNSVLHACLCFRVCRVSWQLSAACS